MKFKEFLKESTVTTAAFAAWKKKLDINVVGHPAHVIVDGGKILIDGSSDKLSIFSLSNKANMSKWASPFSSSDWDAATKMATFIRIDFPNFENLPDVENLNFEHSVIETINGVEKLRNVKVIDFVNMDSNQKPFGVLRLLKILSLKEVMFRDTGWFDSPDEEMKFEGIIQQHLSDKRDIIACQTDLIDAGFDEWAML